MNKKYIVLLLLLLIPLQSFATVLEDTPSTSEITIGSSSKIDIANLNRSEIINLISILNDLIASMRLKLGQSSISGALPLVNGASTSSDTVRLDRKTGKHFNIMWVEPAALYPGVGIVKEKLTTEDFREYVKNFHELGVDTVVTAYSEFIGCTFYKSKLNLPFYRYYQDSNGIWQNALVNPKDAYCPVLSDGDFYPELFKIADELDMKIILGLSRAGDWNLMEDIQANLEKKPLKLNIDVNARLSQSVIVSNNMASELYQLYGQHESFAGWYLPHEVTCIDIGANYYNPVGKHLRTLDSDAEIVISPPATAEVCFGGTLEERLKTMPIDTVMVQDSVGPAYDSINTVYRYSDEYRKKRIAEVGKAYPTLKKKIESAGKKFVINVEGWEMDGNCGGATNGYGCPYPGEFNNRVKSQLETHWNTTHELMINPSFQLFDFGESDGLTRVKSQNETRARAFAKEYTEYLDN